MYEELKITVLFFPLEDVVRTSDSGGLKDDNVDADGWT